LPGLQPIPAPSENKYIAEDESLDLPVQVNARSVEGESEAYHATPNHLDISYEPTHIPEEDQHNGYEARSMKNEEQPDDVAIDYDYDYAADNPHLAPRDVGVDYEYDYATDFARLTARDTGVDYDYDYAADSPHLAPRDVDDEDTSPREDGIDYDYNYAADNPHLAPRDVGIDYSYDYAADFPHLAAEASSYLPPSINAEKYEEEPEARSITTPILSSTPWPTHTNPTVPPTASSTDLAPTVRSKVARAAWSAETSHQAVKTGSWANLFNLFRGKGVASERHHPRSVKKPGEEGHPRWKDQGEWTHTEPHTAHWTHHSHTATPTSVV